MPDFFPRITVVTPNYNQARFLEQTILSVLDQNYPNLEYIIMDGGSIDASTEIIKKYESRLYYWESKKDQGMYDAINKGFSRSTGDIMCWINSDDILCNGSLKYVSTVFSSDPKIKWLQGSPTVIDEEGKIIFQREPVFSKFFFYFKKHEKTFSFIQQESTFWTRKLWNRAGGAMNLHYSLAADFDLWMRFFNYESLYCTPKQLGAFRKRKDQLSGNRSLYLKETNQSLISNFKKLPVSERMMIKGAVLTQKIFGRSNLGFLKDISNKLVSALIGKPKLAKEA